MKQFFTIILLCIFLQGYSQSPHKFSYQTVIRNSSNQLLANQQVGIKISVLQGSENGIVVYSERHTPNTNSNGLATLSIGTGSELSGNFQNINWSSGLYYIQTETDLNGGSNYTITSNQQLLSVPYALYAETSGSSTPGPQGEQGPIGQTGPQGSQGLTGTTGPQGPIGPQGLQGLTGAAGTTGATGPQGPIGLSGPAGATGAQGTQGLPGLTGSTGPAGATGATGSNGINSLVITTNEPAGAICLSGGVKMEYGIDANNNGILDLSEVNNTLTKYVCNGLSSNLTAGDGININENSIINTAPSPWLRAGYPIDSSIYFLNGNVGIGTTYPQAILETNGDILVNSVRIGRGTNPNYLVGYNTVVGREALESITNGDFNTAIGASTLKSNTTGYFNTAIGYKNLMNNTSGSNNVAIGNQSLLNNISGTGNVAIGELALNSSTEGSNNTAIGAGSLSNNLTSFGNVAIGCEAMGLSSLGNGNVAIGLSALQKSLTDDNTAVGNHALNNNISGGGNSSLGSNSLSNNVSGYSNTAIGNSTMFNNIDGNFNTAIGAYSLYNSINSIGNVAIGHGALGGFTDSTGNNNVAIGFSALYNSNTDNCTAVGTYALSNNTSGLQNSSLGDHSLFGNVSGNFNTAIGGYTYSLTGNSDGNTTLGYGAGDFHPHGNYNTFIGFLSHGLNQNQINSVGIGYDANPEESNEVRIGNYAVQSIGGVVNWTTYSDKRYKRKVEEDIPGLEFITKLRPVSYNLDVKGLIEYNSKNTREKKKELGIQDLDISAQTTKKYSGFIAQEVEQAAKEVNYNFSGIDTPETKDGLYGLRYSDFIIPMVKSIQELNSMLNDYTEMSKKQQKKIDELQKEINELKKRNK